MKQLTNSQGNKIKYTIKERKALKKRAWGIFAKWIRERDNNTCVTCGLKLGDKTSGGKPVHIHAGHFCHNREDFNERNVHAQCMGCNWRKKGNMRIYCLRMVEWYGVKYVKELLKCESRPIKLESGEYYLNIIEKYS